MSRRWCSYDAMVFERIQTSENVARGKTDGISSTIVVVVIIIIIIIINGRRHHSHPKPMGSTNKKRTDTTLRQRERETLARNLGARFHDATRRFAYFFFPARAHSGREQDLSDFFVVVTALLCYYFCFSIPAHPPPWGWSAGVELRRHFEPARALQAEQKHADLVHFILAEARFTTWCERFHNRVHLLHPPFSLVEG